MNTIRVKQNYKNTQTPNSTHRTPNSQFQTPNSTPISQSPSPNPHQAFTIVELLIVIVVIGILAAITIVAYNGIQTRARQSSLKSDLATAASQLGQLNATDGRYPSSATSLKKSSTTHYDYTYTEGTNTYCITATHTQTDVGAFHRINGGAIQDGPCSGHEGTAPGVGDGGGGGGSDTIADGVHIQQITSANCPTERTRAVDARDNHTYWVQELDDGKCWMLTNLAYGGGGTNTYNDTRTLTNGGSSSATYTQPRYYIPPGSSPTTEPINPSTSTNGTGQYGYLYNWCGAMGGQASTAACTSSSTPASNPSVTVCPAGWRLPTGGSGGEFTALNNAVNNGAANTDEGLRSTWLGQRSGYWGYLSTFGDQGYGGIYWSSTQSEELYARDLSLDSSGAYPANDYNLKYYGFAVRCVAS